jgi:hypothetical protein
MAAGDMIFLFKGVISGTWRVPTGVTAIKVECFGGTSGGSFNTNQSQSKIVGGSYSQTSLLSVTAGSTIYFNLSSAGSNWINKASNAAPTSTADGCLAVGGGTAAASQVAANVGDIKYAGGDGIAYSGGTTMYGAGGQAGPNGAGANAGAAYSATPFIAPDTSFAYTIGNGGGANGGVSGGLGSIPYGRSSGAFGGNGGYWNGTANVSATQDVLGQAQYLNGYPLRTPLNYGPFGGSQGVYQSFDGDYDVFAVQGQESFIVITVLATTQKSIVFVGNQSGSFTIPSDFGSLASIRSWGAGGINTGGTTATNGGGGGGAGYSETVGASVTSSMVAGSTLVYYSVPALGAGSSVSSWINIGTNSAPSAVTSGVRAFCGANTSNSAGGTGGSTASAVGNTKNAGGSGGTGFGTTRNNGGGGGGAGGPSGAGANGGGAWSFNANRGGGGGGASNGGSAGSAGTSSNGGAGGSISGGTGGAGMTGSSDATAGTNGGGSGGGYANIFNSGAPPKGSVLFFENNSYAINGGTGGDGGRTGNNNSGGEGGAGVYTDSSGNLVYGDGLVVFTYVPTTPVVASEGNFFMFF